MVVGLSLPGYDLIDLLHEGKSTVVYRGRSQTDHQPVILKILKFEYPSLDQITHLKHEYQIIENLDLVGIVKVHQLLTYQNRLALVYEDFGGRSLKQLLVQQPLSVDAFLHAAIQLTDALASLHQHHIIHKDIKPANIIINPQTGQVKLTDFSIASRLNKETPQFTNPNQLEGTLAYMSPEQTGRMNRAVDYRSDFYSLGVTFYEILTGQLPFQSSDPLELVHCHIAKSSIPIHELRQKSVSNKQQLEDSPLLTLYSDLNSNSYFSKIPHAISDIVTKLMAKNAEDRYQSAMGLKADLDFCLTQLNSTGTIPLLTPGLRDRTAQLLIPQKLYGRQQEVESLLAAFDRVAAKPEPTTPFLHPSNPLSNPLSIHPPTPHSELVLVSGYSGIGKSSLVNEIHKPIVQKRGYFIAGKFDQLKRNIPYASLIQAFQSLMQQLLTESASQLQLWKEKLLAALKSNGQIIIEVIPEVELIIDRQSPVPELGAHESQNRFNQVFQSFVQVFTQPDHPLVLFLDDLQWADSASLKLIQMLMTHPHSQYLLLVGAYRDNEVSPIHPLTKTLEEIKDAGVVINHIMLQPLELVHIKDIVSDTFAETGTQIAETKNQEFAKPVTPKEHIPEQALRHPSEPKIAAFAELLFQRTQGNPFFLGQLLKSLHQEQWLTFDFAQNCWQWDLQAIRSADITTKDVIELLSQNIEKLPAITQTVLKLAACVGNRFSLDVLATVSEMSLSDTATALDTALQNGFVLPLNSDYKIPLLFASDELKMLEFDYTRIAYRFSHDRVQQAAYSLIPDNQKKVTHLRVGQLLLKNTASSELESNLFEIVNALNLGSDLIEQPLEKTELARLNLLAGQKAKAAMAYEAANSYLAQGMALQGNNDWQTDYAFTLTLYATAAETAYLTTDYERSEQLVNAIEQQAVHPLDKTKAYELKIQLYMAQLEMWKSIMAGIEALAILGVPIASRLNWDHQTIQLPQLTELEHSPEMTDPERLAALRILTTLVSPSYQTQSEIFCWVALTQLELCIEHGHSALAAFAYVAYAWLCITLGLVDRAYQAGKIALKLLEQFDAKELQPGVVQIFECFVRHHKEHIRETFLPLTENIQNCLETGDIGFASYSAMNHITHIFFSGEVLERSNQAQIQYLELLLKLKQEFQIGYAQLWRQVTLNLQGKATHPCNLIGESFDETVMLSRLRAAQNHQSLFAFYAAKTILCYLFQDYRQAVEAANAAKPFAGSGAGLMLSAVYDFYAALAYLAYCDATDTAQFEQYQQIILEHQHKLQQWAKSAPMNYQHKYELVNAEFARLEGQIATAILGYDRAIQSALENGYIQEAALANERAATFYWTQGKQRIAQGYMTDAYYGYIQWGAIAKVQHLEEKYANLIIRNESTTPSIATTETVIAEVSQSISSTSSSSNILDLATVMKAAQTISSELNLHHLLEKLLSIILENAGACKGCLILEKDGQLFVEAIDDDPDRLFVTLQSTPVETSSDIPRSLINYVARTQQPKVLIDARQDNFFNTDPYIQIHQPKSVLCVPIFYQGKFTGILYLENTLTTGAFTSERLELLRLLTAQAAIAIENARLYSREQAQSQQLRESLQQLQDTQLQLVQNEKMATLGNLVAGVAHEINNPLGFLKGSLGNTEEYIRDLFKHLECYQQSFPDSPSAIQSHAETIDLEFLTDDLPKMLDSMKGAIDRIQTISTSLRAFSRADTHRKVLCDIHEGIDSTLLILKYRLKANEKRTGIDIIKHYGDLPLVECFPGQLNQVFMNILANAIDALEEAEIEQPTIWVQTQWVNMQLANNAQLMTHHSSLMGDRVVIRIRDNGIGIPEQVKQRIFDHLFTTKSIEKGTGLGLAISHQIVVEKHGGTLQVNSVPGEGAEFIITLPASKDLP